MKKWWLLLCMSVALAFGACVPTDNGSSGGGNDGVHIHADANSDGACDGCVAKINTVIDFYSINDLHGKFDDTYANCGVDEMSTYLRGAQYTNPNTIILSAGDMWQGSAESNFTKGAIVTEWMNDLGFVGMAMGNHEYDWGESFIESNAALADFPFLAINIYDRATNERVDYCQPSVTVEVSGVQIGIIGAIGDCYSSISPDKVQDIYFKTGADLTSLVKAESAKLRQEGAEMIVYVLHDSFLDEGHYDSALSNGYVDLVFEGHTHQQVKRQDSHGVWHLQAGGDNKNGLSHARVTLNILTDKVTVNKAEIVSHSTYANNYDDEIVDELLNKYADDLQKVNEVLGNNDTYRDDDALTAFAAQTMYEHGEARWGDDPRYAGKIVLGGGYLNVRYPYYLPAKDVTYGDLYSLFTFDNPIVLCSVSGYRLKRQFINSTNYVMYYGEDGLQIKNNVVDNETYYVVVDTYCALFDFAGMGYLNIVDYYDEEKQVFTRDLLAEFIKDGGMTSEIADEYTSILDLLAIGEDLPLGGETTERYRVKGRVVDIENNSKGILTIADDDNNELYIYRINNFSSLDIKPGVGDTIVLEGKILKYFGAYQTIIEMKDATLCEVITGSGGGSTAGEYKLTLSSGFGGSDISKYDTGNYGEYTVSGIELEYYRAYRSGDCSIACLLPNLNGENDGTMYGTIYNVDPIYGIYSITITYKSATAATLYTGDDRVSQMTAYTLTGGTSFQTLTFTVDSDNFFKIDTGDSVLHLQALEISYTNQVVSYNTVKQNAGANQVRLNPTVYQGTLVAGQSQVSVPISVSYQNGNLEILETRTYTYYTLEYVESHPSVKSAAAMLDPMDVAAYYTAFKQFPANYAAKNFDGNDFSNVRAVFGNDTRYVSKYSRTNGYAQYVPYKSGQNVYYEFDIGLQSSYWEDGERGVGRVVAWESGWNVSTYANAPVCVYTDDHYATFQEYLNTGEFGTRFDAERDLTYFKWSAPETVSAQ